MWQSRASIVADSLNVQPQWLGRYIIVAVHLRSSVSPNHLLKVATLRCCLVRLLRLCHRNTFVVGETLVGGCLGPGWWVSTYLTHICQAKCVNREPWCTTPIQNKSASSGWQTFKICRLTPGAHPKTSRGTFTQVVKPVYLLDDVCQVKNWISQSMRSVSFFSLSHTHFNPFSDQVHLSGMLQRWHFRRANIYHCSFCRHLLHLLLPLLLQEELTRQFLFIYFHTINNEKSLFMFYVSLQHPECEKNKDFFVLTSHMTNTKENPLKNDKHQNFSVQRGHLYIYLYLEVWKYPSTLISGFLFCWSLKALREKFLFPGF